MIKITLFVEMENCGTKTVLKVEVSLKITAVCVILHLSQFLCFGYLHSKTYINEINEIILHVSIDQVIFNHDR